MIVHMKLPPAHQSRYLMEFNLQNTNTNTGMMSVKHIQLSELDITLPIWTN